MSAERKYLQQPQTADAALNACRPEGRRLAATADAVKLVERALHGGASGSGVSRGISRPGSQLTELMTWFGRRMPGWLEAVCCAPI